MAILRGQQKQTSTRLHCPRYPAVDFHAPQQIAKPSSCPLSASAPIHEMLAIHHDYADRSAQSEVHLVGASAERCPPTEGDDGVAEGRDALAWGARRTQFA